MEKQYQKISVLLAAYNGSCFIREQLDSILTQSYSEFELLICDDCSTDDTVAILTEYAQKDNRIKMYRNEQNLGFKKNFERLLTLASGDYIALSDQDDVWTKDHLEKLMFHIGNNDLVCGNAYLADENAESMGVTLLSCADIDRLPQTADEWFMFLLHGSIFQGAACLFRKNLFATALSIPQTVRFHDYWLAVQAALQGGIGYFTDPILFYRQHGTNITSNKKWNVLDKIRQAFDRAESKKKLAEQIGFLAALYDRTDDSAKKHLVKNALTYYKNYQDGKRLANVPYFCKNYRLMYLSERKRYFIARFIKKFIFCK